MSILFNQSKKYLRIFLFSLAISLLASGREILTQIQFGTDSSTVQNPITTSGTTTTSITFPDSYSSPPTVLIYLTEISITKTNLQNYKVDATSITKLGFSLVYTVQFIAQLISLKVSWVAFEQSNNAEVIYQEINGVNLNNASLLTTVRSDIFQINFANTYTNVPNVAVFLLGLSSLVPGMDTVNIAYTGTTQTGTSVAVAAWNSAMLDKASFVVFVVNSDMSLSQPGSQNNVVSGAIDVNSKWIDTTQTNRSISMTQTSTGNVTTSGDRGATLNSISGFRGYDVETNVVTNLKYDSQSFSGQTFKQTIETWGSSQVVAGYWYSFALNSTPYSLSSLDSSGFAWWLILIIFLVVLIVVIIIVLLIIYCERRKKRRLQEAEEAQKEKVQIQDETKIQNDISSNDQNKDLSILKANQDNQQTIIIVKNKKDDSLIYNDDDYIEHKENKNQNTVTNNQKNIQYLYNTNYISPKTNQTEANLKQNQTSKVLYFQDPAPTRKEQQSNNLTKQQTTTTTTVQQNNQQELQYYRNPRTQYENVNNNTKEEENAQLKQNTITLTTVTITGQAQQQQQNPDQSKQISQNNINQKSPTNEKQDTNLVKQNTQIQAQANPQKQTDQPIDRTFQEIDHQINGYKKEQQDSNLNKLQEQQANSNGDTLKTQKTSNNYDIYRQISLNKQKFDNQKQDPTYSQNSQQQPYLIQNQDQNNNNNNINNSALILSSNRYNDQPNQNNLYSNNSTYRPLQNSSRMDDQQAQQNQNNNTHLLNNYSRKPLSQAGTMIVNNNINNNNYNNLNNNSNGYNNNNNKKFNDSYSSSQSIQLQGTTKDLALTTDSVYRNPTQPLINLQRGGASDILSVEDHEDDMPRRPKEQSTLPLI